MTESLLSARIRANLDRHKATPSPEPVLLTQYGTRAVERLRQQARHGARRQTVQSVVDEEKKEDVVVVRPAALSVLKLHKERRILEDVRLNILLDSGL